MNITRVVFSYVPIGMSELNAVEFNWIDHSFNVRKANRVYHLNDETVAAKIITFVNEHQMQLNAGEFEKHEFGSNRYLDVRVYLDEGYRLIKTVEAVAAFIDEIFEIRVCEEQRIDLEGVFVSVDAPYQPSNNTMMGEMMAAKMNMQSAMVDQRCISSQLYKQPVDPWDCSCGQKGNVGKFCPNCGLPHNKKAE